MGQQQHVLDAVADDCAFCFDRQETRWTLERHHLSCSFHSQAGHPLNIVKACAWKALSAAEILAAAQQQDLDE